MRESAQLLLVTCACYPAIVTAFIHSLNKYTEGSTHAEYWLGCRDRAANERKFLLAWNLAFANS